MIVIVIKTGDRVKISSITRVRTIFQNAEVTPGTTKTHNLNAAGIVTNVYEDPLLSYEVKVDGKPEGQDHIEVNPGELVKIQPTSRPGPSRETGPKLNQLADRSKNGLR